MGVDNDSAFTFSSCPECGGSIRAGGLFSSMGMVCAGKNGECEDCGKQWHVIREDKPEEDST